MNWINQNSILFFIAVIGFVGCDTFEEDTFAKW
jgi:hypothetical protein